MTDLFTEHRLIRIITVCFESIHGYDTLCSFHLSIPNVHSTVGMTLSLLIIVTEHACWVTGVMRNDTG